MSQRAASQSEQRTIRVFIASPGDLAVERRAFKDVLDELNAGFGEGLNVKFEALGWEDTLASTGRRSQSVINVEVDRADVFVLTMHRRWGQEAPDAQPYSSYTEEEFHRAFDRWKETKAPEIFVFFKHIDPGQMADAGPQLQKVLDFRRSLEESRQVLYHEFTDRRDAKRLGKRTFVDLIDWHLRAFAKGELPKADAPLDTVLLPLAVLEEVRKEKAEKEQALARAEQANQLAEAAVARADMFALGFAERAAKAALEGRVEEARQDFAKATDGTTNLRVLSLAFEFYERTGDLTMAEEMLERWLAISGRDAKTANTAAALGNLGLIYQKRGELDRAEEMVRKAMAIDEYFGNKEGIARHSGSLGMIYWNRGNLDQAATMITNSLTLNELLGRQTSMATQFGNLGLIYQTRGELSMAEKMHQNSLRIAEVLGNQECIANQLGNLGVIYTKRGELDRAEEMHRKALIIDKKLDRQEGMATQYAGLGVIYQKRGELDHAEEMHRKALFIDERIGNQVGVARHCGNLGVVYQSQIDLDRAEEMLKRSLVINEKLGRQEGVAKQYGNLGSVAEARGDLKRARELWTKARDLFGKIGMPHMVKQMQGWLDGLPPAEAKE